MLKLSEDLSGPRRTVHCTNHLDASYRPRSEQSRTARRISCLYAFIAFEVKRRVTVTPSSSRNMAGNSDSTDKRDDDQGISPAEFQKDTTEMEPTPPSPGSSNHAELLDHAREFLASPAVRTQSGADKRRFLLEKGLSPASADALLPENQVGLSIVTAPRCSGTAYS